MKARSPFVGRKNVESGWPPERIEVKYNIARDHARQQVDAGTAFVLLTRLAPEKGVDVLLYEWVRAFRCGEESLVIAGRGELESALGMHSGLRAVEFARLLKDDKAIELVRRARAVIVVPSVWYEPFGRLVAEAYLLRVAAIALGIGALSEIIRDGENGILSESASPAAFARALPRLVAAPETGVRLGTNGRRLLEQEASSAVISRRLVEIYGAVAACARTQGSRIDTTPPALTASQ